MADQGKKQQDCNPTMELAMSAACVSRDGSSQQRLGEIFTDCTERPVTIDYIAGFHSGS